MTALYVETAEKIKIGYAKVVRYGDIKGNTPENLRTPPVAMILKKLRCNLKPSWIYPFALKKCTGNGFCQLGSHQTSTVRIHDTIRAVAHINLRR